MADLDRAAVIDLLGRLGAESDADALAAARELSRLVRESGLSWAQLLRPDDATEQSIVAARTVERPSAAAGHGAEARLVERLLARTDISDTLRSDLNDFKKQIAGGKLDREDADYIRAVAKRLGA